MENPPSNLQLSQKEKKHLRGLAQQIKASILVGKGGLSEAVLTELKAAFKREQLVKVRVAGNREQLKACIAQIETETSSLCVAKVGFTATFYREHPAATGSV